MAWQTGQRGHAVANGLPVVTVNRVGQEQWSMVNGQCSMIPFWGTSFVAGPQGELLYEAPTDREVETVVDVDMQRSEQVRRWWPFLRDRRIENYDGLTKRFID
jgi:N-carbamoylputrescine amidase